MSAAVCAVCTLSEGEQQDQRDRDLPIFTSGLILLLKASSFWRKTGPSKLSVQKHFVLHRGGETYSCLMPSG